jgi:hypothetical protein
MKSIASAVSASASAQLFPTSSTIHAENAWRRSRMRFAASIRYAARSAAGTRLQTRNARSAVSTACTACAFEAALKRPSTSAGRAGFVDSNSFSPFRRSPPITIGYSRPAPARTAASAASNALRCSATVKSV